MSLSLCHISDTHGYHGKLTIPRCNILIHTGDIGGRTSINELTEFLIWFEKQPSDVKIFCGGNHDLVLDKKEAAKEKAKHNTFGWLRCMEQYDQAMQLIQNYNVVYLNGKDYVYEGVKFWGSPYSPSFHREYWAFNADRGAEINKEWAKIPNDVNVLLTHTPCFNILDDVSEDHHNANENPHVGCVDLLAVIRKRLFKLKLHCAGHLHQNYGLLQLPITNKRRLLFSNGAVTSHQGDMLITHPLIITI